MHWLCCFFKGKLLLPRLTIQLHVRHRRPFPAWAGAAHFEVQLHLVGLSQPQTVDFVVEPSHDDCCMVAALQSNCLRMQKAVLLGADAFHAGIRRTIGL